MANRYTPKFKFRVVVEVLEGQNPPGQVVLFGYFGFLPQLPCLKGKEGVEKYPTKIGNCLVPMPGGN